MTARPNFTVSGTKAAGDVPTVQVDGSVAWAAPSGSSPVITHETLSSAGITVPNGGGGYQIPWAHAANDVLMDLSDPNYPAFIAAGVYAVTVFAFPVSPPMTVDGRWLLDFELDFFGDAKVASMDSTPASALVTAPSLTISMTYYMPAGAAILAAVSNHDGAATITFRGAMYIQQLA